MTLTRSLILIVALLIAASCGSPEQATEETTSTSSTESVESSNTLGSVSPSTSPESEDPATTTPTDTDIDESLVPFVDQAVADLAGRLDVSESSIEVASAKLVTWSDASLGCPEPGMQYAQVLTDGALIELVADNRTYSYHMGGNEYEPFLCEEPSAPIESDSGSKETETRSTPYGDLVFPVTEDTVPPPGYDE